MSLLGVLCLVAAIFIVFMLIMAHIADRHDDITKWNQGWCPQCLCPWVAVRMDTNGDRHYECERKTHKIIIHHKIEDLPSFM